MFSAHLPDAWRDGRAIDAHSVRLVYEGWVPVDAPAPRVVEVDGSTVDAAWHPVSTVLDGTLPVPRSSARPWPRTSRSGCSGWRRTHWWCATERCC